MTLQITLPLPPRETSPNWRGHWGAKSMAVKNYRSTAWTLALEAAGKQLLWTSATAQATFFHTTKRNRDKDNALASLKPAFDGFADAGVVFNDSGFTHLPVKFETDRENPRVEIRITKGAGK